MAGFSDFHLKCVYLMSALDIFSVGLAIPLLSPYLRSMGASHFIIGLSTSLYGAAQLISSPVVGSWSDRHGRISVLSISLGACSLGYLMLGKVNTVLLILPLRLLLGCFKHTQSLCKSIIGDEVPPYEQANAYGKLAAISGVGFIVGPVIGGHLADHERGFSLVTTIIMVCFWINIAIAQFLPTQHRQRSRTSSGNSGIKAELFKVLGHLKNINWGKHQNILFLKFLHSIVGSTTSFLSGQVQHFYEWRYPPQKASAVQIVHCFIAMAVSLVGTTYTDTTLGLLCWIIPLASGSALLRTLLTELLVQKSLPQERGSIIGAGNSFAALSRLCAPLISGIAADWYGTSLVSLLSQVMAGAGAFSAHCLLKGEYLQHYTR